MADKFTSLSDKKKCEKLNQRYEVLKKERDPWLARWKDVSKYVKPEETSFAAWNRGKYSTTDSQYVYSNAPTKAFDTLVAGLAGGATSPARKWFKITPNNPLGGQIPDSVKKWCSDVENILIKTFHDSNTYNSLHSLYKHLCLFGIGADIISTDPDNVVSHLVLEPGSFCIQSDSRGVVNTLYREFEMTVAQLVERFGWDNVSNKTRELFESGHVDNKFLICHAIEPRSVRDHKALDNKNMPFASYYFYLEKGDKEGIILEESGYQIFPVICPRWDVITSNNYGSSPAMAALPNIKQLQVEVKLKLQLLELMADPPLIAPHAARQEPISMMPGSINYSTGLDMEIKPIINGTAAIDALTADIYNLQREIESDFYSDLFLMIQSQQDDRKTATEIQALKEEKMLVLGPVIERLQHELLEPLIDLTIDALATSDMLPPAPGELAQEGLSLEAEFSSMLAQSQRVEDINAMDRFISAITAVAGSRPEILDNINPDSYFRLYMERMGINPGIALDQNEVDQVRQQRADAAAAAQQAEQMQAAGALATDLTNAQRNSAQASLATQKLDEVGGMAGLF